VERLTEEHLPRLLRTAADISRDWALLDTVPISVHEAGRGAVPLGAPLP